MATTDFQSVDEYIASFPADVQVILQEVRAAIRAVVPGVGEKISYQLPTITMDGQALMYFSGWRKHIAVYHGRPNSSAGSGAGGALSIQSLNCLVNRYQSPSGASRS